MLTFVRDAREAAWVGVGGSGGEERGARASLDRLQDLPLQRLGHLVRSRRRAPRLPEAPVVQVDRDVPHVRAPHDHPDLLLSHALVGLEADHDPAFVGDDAPLRHAETRQCLHDMPLGRPHPLLTELLVGLPSLAQIPPSNLACAMALTIRKAAPIFSERRFLSLFCLRRQLSFCKHTQNTCATLYSSYATSALSGSDARRPVSLR